MARKTSEELQAIMKAENCNRLWSWSKFNTFHNSMYEYFLRYIRKVKEDRKDSIYVSTGGIAHDILEKFYTGELKYEDMVNEFDDGWTTAYEIADLRFDRSNDEKNKKIADKYYLNVKHFFENHVVLKHKPVIEQFIKAKIGSNLFQGYIDVCYKDDEENFHILDWKTSSIYKGKKAENECGQLIVYAIGLNQQGIPMDKIKIGWNFLKYVSVKYEQKNGTVKTREIERHEIGEKLKSNVKIWLKQFGYESQIDYYLDLLVQSNDIKCLPEEVQNKYIVSDCIVEVPITEELIKRWTDDIITTINDIELREKDYEETGNDKAFWDSEESVEKQSYYFHNLCGYSPNLHLPYQEYLNRLEALQNEKNNMFSGVGADTEANTFSKAEQTNNSETSKNNGDDVDMSWLEQL